jgi:glycerol kinase
LEAIAFEVRDVMETMPHHGTPLRVDGGASANDLLCQVQADQLGVDVQRPELVETTALGAAFLAGLGTGVWASTDELRDTWQLERTFTPAADRAEADAAHARWQDAVERSKGWARS